jgi:hypothetical protein
MKRDKAREASRPEHLAAVRRAASLARQTFAGGRPRSRQKRCACGAMTAKRAKTRGHKC